MKLQDMAVLFSRLAYAWPNEPLPPELATKWLEMGFAPLELDDVLEGMGVLYVSEERRPPISKIIASAKAARAGRPAPLSLPEPKNEVPLSIRQQVRTTLGMKPPEDAA